MAKNQITAIDIGTNSVKILQMELTQTGVMIKNSGVASYPRQSATETISDEVVTDTLSQLIRSRLFKTSPVAMSIPRRLATVKSLAGLPTTATDEEIDKMVPLQVEPELPFAIADAVYSAYNIQRAPEGISLEVVATKRTSIERYLGIAEKVGLVLQGIIPSSFATYGVIFDQFKEQLAGKTIAVADIGAGMTDICIIQHGRLAFSRSFTFGGNSLTQQFESDHKLSFSEAEQRKIAEANLKSDEGSNPAHRWAENLATDIDRSFRAFTGERGANGAGSTEEIDNLWLCGGSSLVPGLDDYLSSRLDIETSLWNPMQGMGDQSLEDGLQRGLSVALGTGIVGIAGEERTPTVNANLLPIEIRERKQRARKKITTLVAIALVVVVISAAGVGFIGWRRSQAAELNRLAESLLVLEQKDEIKNAKAALEKSILMQYMMTPYVTPLEVLRKMSENLPDRRSVALNNLYIDKKGKVTMSVEAKSIGDVNEMIQALYELEITDEVRLFDEVKQGAIQRVTKQKKPILQVQIACQLNIDAMQEIK